MVVGGTSEMRVRWRPETGAEASMEEGVVVTVLEDTGRPTGADGGMGAGGACWGLSSTSDATGEAGNALTVSVSSPDTVGDDSAEEATELGRDT